MAADAPLANVLAHACLTLTAIAPSGAILGAVALFPRPPLADVLPAAADAPARDAAIAAAACSAGIELPAALLVPLLVVDPYHEESVLTALLLAVFEQCPSVSQLLLVAEAELQLAQPYLLSVFAVSQADVSSAHLYVAARETVRAPLRIRQAVVEDNDDVMPVVAAASRHYGSLGVVPDSEGAACPLASLLAAQDERNVVLVAESDAGEVVGLVAVTCDVDMAAVWGAYELDAFDSLMPPEQYDALRAESLELLTQTRLAEARERIAAIQVSGAACKLLGVVIQRAVQPLSIRFCAGR